MIRYPLLVKGISDKIHFNALKVTMLKTPAQNGCSIEIPMDISSKIFSMEMFSFLAHMAMPLIVNMLKYHLGSKRS